MAEEDKPTFSDTLRGQIDERLANRGIQLQGEQVDLSSPLFDTVPLHSEGRREKRAGFGESFKRAFGAENEFNLLAKAIPRKLSDFAMKDPVFSRDNPDWSPVTHAALDGLDPEYYGYVINAHNPNDQDRRRSIAFDRMENKRKMENGTILGNLAGAGAGAVISPTSIFPILALSSKVGFISHTFGSAAKILPSIALQSVAHESIVEAANPGFNAEHLVLNTVRDAAIGTMLYGLGRAVTYTAKTKDLWKARGIVNSAYDGVGVKVSVDESGNRGPLVAFATDDSVGAARVAEANRFLNSEPVYNAISGFLGKLGGATWLGSPLLKGMNSPFPVVRNLTNLMSNNSIITHGVRAGEPLQETMDDIVKSYGNEALQTALQIGDLYQTSIGVKPGATSSIQTIVKKLNTDGQHSRQLFDFRVNETVVTGIESPIKEVNEAAKIRMDFESKLWKEYTDLYDLPNDIGGPRNAINYMTINYNAKEMVDRPQDFVNMVANGLRKQDETIVELKKPITELELKIKSLNEELSIPLSQGGRRVGAIQADLLKTKNQLKSLEKKMIKDMRDGNIDPALLEDTVWLTNAEHEQLKELLKPVDDLTAKIERLQSEVDFLGGRQATSPASKDRKRMAAIQKEIKDLSTDFEVNKTKIQKLSLEKAKLERQVRNKTGEKNVKEQLIEAKEEKSSLLDDLRNRAEDGEINRNLYIRNDSGQIEFRIRDAVPKFRKIHPTQGARLTEGRAFYDSIQNLTPEQINNAVLSRMSSGGSDPSSARTLMIPQKDILDAGFLLGDIEASMISYARTLGRRIAMKRSFESTGVDGGIQGITETLSRDVSQRINKIINETVEGSKEQKKLLRKLNKEKIEAEKFIRDAYNGFMGNINQSEGANRIARTLNQAASIAQLKNVPLLQSVEISGLVIKQGFWPTIVGGIMPWLGKINPLVSSPEFAEHAAHAGFAVNLEVTRLAQNLVDGYGRTDVAGTVVSNKVERFFRGMSNAAHALFGTNMIMNSQQRISANATQSRIMADMFKMSKGKLSEAAKERLLINGIDPEDFALYIEQYNKSNGHPNGFGAYQSDWYNWEDKALSAKIKHAIANDIEGSILESGTLDKPFTARNNALGQFMFHYMGYTYAAYNRFLIPAAQSPTADRMAGIFLLISLSSTIEPLRRWQKGETFLPENEKAFDQWFASGFADSALGGWPVEALQRAMAMVDTPTLDRYSQDKFRRRPPMGIAFGPVGSYLDSVAQTMGMVINGDINKKQLKKSLSVSPIALNLLLDKQIKSMIDNSNLPENRSQAR